MGRLKEEKKQRKVKGKLFLLKQKLDDQSDFTKTYITPFFFNSPTFEPRIFMGADYVVRVDDCFLIFTCGFLFIIKPGLLLRSETMQR
jgi:hypothetical protein